MAHDVFSQKMKKMKKAIARLFLFWQVLLSSQSFNKVLCDLVCLWWFLNANTTNMNTHTKVYTNTGGLICICDTPHAGGLQQVCILLVERREKP